MKRTSPGACAENVTENAEKSALGRKTMRESTDISAFHVGCGDGTQVATCFLKNRGSRRKTMIRMAQVALMVVALVGSAVFAATPETLAARTHGRVILSDGGVNWNGLRSAFEEVIGLVDAAKIETIADATILTPKVFDSVLAADGEIAMFRASAVRRRDTRLIWSSFVAKSSVMQARLANLEALIKTGAEPKDKDALLAKYGKLRGAIVSLWLANMQFDPDSLGGAGFPFPGGSDEGMHIMPVWEETDNQNYQIYQESQEAVRDLIREIGKALS